MASYSEEHGKFSHLVICLFNFKSKYNSDYKELLSKFNVQIVEITDEEQCQFIMSSIKCNGILIDIPTYIKSPMYIKEFISNIESIYPAARMRYNIENRELELMMLSERKQLSLQEFLEDHCANFDAKILRKHKRVAFSLNLHVFYENDGEPAEFFCTSSNISETGLFIVSGTNCLRIMTKVKIQILEFGKDSFLHGTVMRSLKWGEKRFHAPGIGIRIDHIDDEIYEDYIGLIQKH